MQTNCDTSVHPDPDPNGSVQTNPFYIPEITDHMFQFLELRDIKICRSVCRKWNQLAENFLKKLSVVEIFTSDRLDRFNQEFPNAQQSQIFTGFGFSDFEWHNAAGFFEKWNDNLSKITLSSVSFGPDNENETYDLSPLLPSTLTKLKIESCNPKWIIATDKICNIRILDLQGCILNIVTDIVLNTVEIELQSVTFREDENNVEHLVINPLLNFDVSKKASFSGENIMLDLQGSQSLNVLSLDDGVTVLNWKKSNWEIKKLFLGVYTSKEKEDLSKSQIKYKELEICLQHLNVSLLPEGIEKLEVSLHNDQEVPPRISGEHKLTELKHLYIILEPGIDFSPFVEFFKHCPKLSIITVELTDPHADSNINSILKSSALPQSVKTLRVVNRIRIILDQTFQLESLFLYDAGHHEHLKNIVDIAKELCVKNLMWFGIDSVKVFDDDDVFVFDNEQEKLVKSLIDLNLDNFALGDISQSMHGELEISYVFPLVDTKEKYYLLQRGKDIAWNLSKYGKVNRHCLAYKLINKQV